MMNEGSYEVWVDFLNKRRHGKENAKISDRLIQNSLAKSYINSPNKPGRSEFEQDLIAMYGADLAAGVEKLKLSKQDIQKVLKNATPEQKRKFLEILEKSKDK